MATLGPIDEAFRYLFGPGTVGDSYPDDVIVCNLGGTPGPRYRIPELRRDGRGRPPGFDGTIVHDLRRSVIRNMIRAGVSEPVAMSISGHQSAAIFRRYNITSVDDQRRALAATQAYAAARGRKDKRSSR